MSPLQLKTIRFAHSSCMSKHKNDAMKALIQCNVENIHKEKIRIVFEFEVYVSLRWKGVYVILGVF